MKVKCKKNKIYSKEKIYNNITINKEYIVLAIEFYNREISIFSNSIGDYILYRIEDDEGSVCLLPSKLFVVTSGELYRNWIMSYENEESYSILPREWANSEFWEEFYDDEYNAKSIFKSVRDNIYLDETR